MVRQPFPSQQTCLSRSLLCKLLLRLCFLFLKSSVQSDIFVKSSLDCMKELAELYKFLGRCLFLCCTSSVQSKVAKTTSIAANKENILQ
ncbi:hypothetical protein CY35_19G059700 [Sphagnum magellanicum]|nr:hypothetical protein CY35_19G059700 [Sphagnum magellanicum]